MKVRSEIAFIEEVLNLASFELTSRFNNTLKIQTKKDNSIVTDADLASEKVIIDMIQKFFPDDIIYAEESGQSTPDRKAGKGIWIIDPLDGTSNFANSYPFFCISIGRGFINKNNEIEITAGGIRDPMQKTTFLAEKSKGAFCNGERMHVAGNREFSQTFLVTGFYYLKNEDLSRQVERFLNVSQACQTIRRDGAAALDLALVANGVFDGFWEYGLQPWDVAAGSLMVKEAGGYVFNYDSTSFNVESKGIVAGNKPTTATLIDLIMK